jgi:hypothetical protein
MKTHQEHVQAVREGRDYKAPKLAINETIDHLVDCALIVKNYDVPLTAETRALDAIGVQVSRELKNRAQMILALTDRLATEEAERAEVTKLYKDLHTELETLRAQYEALTNRQPQGGPFKDDTREQIIAAMPSVAG